MEICAGCNCSIEDKYLLKIRAESWHEQCVACSVCGCHLQESCFVRDNELYCRYDYAKKFGARCSCCGQPIGSKELVMRANQHAYHVTCFACIACGLPLRKGDQFVVRDGRLFCRFDYERELAAALQLQQDQLQQQQQQQQPEQPSAQQQATVPPRSPRSDDLDELDDSDSEQGGRGGAKRPRTILSTGQRRKFKSAFEVNPKPSRKVRESLAAETGLSVRVVQVWFQNQRAKVKKLARRQTAAAAAASVAAASAGAVSDATGDSPTTADSTAAAHSIVMGDDALSIGALDIGVNGEVMLHHHGNNNNNNNNNSSSINHNHSGSSSLSMLDNLTKTEDPMDKLYSMQTAYFT